ncbi:diaminopimelate epimerase [Candidatus Margulisiibacteriota bacterium]
MKFTKMHGLGNDFIVFDGRTEKVTDVDWQNYAPRLCDRNFGIGADGILLVLPAEKADYEMRVFNPDGSEPEMCGNGLRCFAKYIYDTSKDKKEVISVQTKAGIKLPVVEPEKGHVQGIEVDMGEPILHRKQIPLAGKDSAQVVGEELSINGQSFKFTAVSMGNPHVVIFVDDVEKVDLPALGPKIEHHELFPERTNVEFVQVSNKKEANMRVWERGAGETLACGTGACAVLVAGVLNKKLDRMAVIHLEGGDLEIEWEAEKNHVLMTGPAVTVYQGEVNII